MRRRCNGWRPPPGRAAAIAWLALLLPAAAPVDGGPGSARLAGVVQAVEADRFLVDSSWVVAGGPVRWKGRIRSRDRIAPGQFAVLSGGWDADGAFRPDAVTIERSVPGVGFQARLAESGGEEARRIEAKEDLLFADAALAGYVRRVGRRVTPPRATSPDYRIRFHLLDNRHLNAFALPTGDIYVHTGLLAKVDSEDQLASVLGHEVAHVTERHMQRYLESRRIRISIFRPGFLPLGLPAGDDDADADRLLVTMVGLGLRLGTLAATDGYGRDLEDQADRVGLRFLWEGGYNPKEAPAVWEIFSTRYGDTPAAVSFFYSHRSANRVRHRNQETEIARHYAAARPWSGPERDERRAAYLSRVAGLVRRVAVEDWEAGQKGSARSGFEKLLRLDPDDAEARDYLARPD